MVVSILIGGLAVGCAEDSAPLTLDPPAEKAGASSAATHVHSDDHHHGDHLPPAALRRTALTLDDLPEGYQSGAGHHHVDTSGPAPPVAAGCEPLAEVIGDHPEVQQTTHPQVRSTFTNSHFGPQITQTVIDYGDEALAEEAVQRFERVDGACARYVQAVDAPGAQDYRVVAPTSIGALPEGAVVSLAARGADFDGIRWVVWVAQVDTRLVGVALRTARGGSSADLPGAVRVALKRAQTA